MNHMYVILDNKDEFKTIERMCKRLEFLIQIATKE